MNNQRTQSLRNQYRKDASKDKPQAILGDATGLVPDSNLTGNVWIQQLTPNGLSAARSVKAPSGKYLTLDAGTPILLEYDYKGNLRISEVDNYTTLALGNDPIGQQLAEASSWTPQLYFSTLSVLPTSPPSLSVSVRSWPVIVNGIISTFVGGQIEALTPPATDYQYYAVLFVRDDFSTIDVQTSTPYLSSDVNQLIPAIQECIDIEFATYPTATPIWAILVEGDQTEITLQGIQVNGLDLRQMVNVNSAASTSNMYQEDIITRKVTIPANAQGNYREELTIEDGGELVVLGRLYIIG